MDEHDTIYKLLFAHDQMIQDLLTGFLPEEWVVALELDSLEKINGSYVTDDLRGRHGDAVWRIRWGEDWLYIYLLLEFQSSVDRFMALRIMVYTALLHQDLIRRGELGTDRRLPPVLPVVLYNGERRWRAPTELRPLIQPPPDGLEHHRSSDEVVGVLQLLVKWLAGPEQVGLRRDYLTWLRRRLPKWFPGETFPKCTTCRRRTR